MLPVGPRGTRTGGAPGGDIIGFLPQTKDRATCWALVEWLLSDAVQIEDIVAQGYGLPHPGRPGGEPAVLPVFLKPGIFTGIFKPGIS